MKRIAWLTVALLAWAGPAGSDQWNSGGVHINPTSGGASYEQRPDGADARALADDFMREMKWEIRRRAEVEIDWGTPAGTLDTGLLREGSARAFYETAIPTDINGPGYYDGVTETHPATLLTTDVDPGAPVVTIGEGRLLVDSDGPDNVASTADDNKLSVHSGTAFVEVKAQHDDPGEFLGGAANLLVNGDFEDAADAATSAPLGWIATDGGGGGVPTLVHADTPLSEGVGHDIQVTDTGAGTDSLRQTLAGLKATTVYYVVARVAPTAGDTCRVFVETTGGTDLTVNSTGAAGAYETLTGTFTTDGVVSDAVLDLMSVGNGDVCAWDHVGVYEHNDAHVPTPGRLVQWDIAADSDGAIPDDPTGTGVVDLYVTVPGPGYAIKVTGEVCSYGPNPWPPGGATADVVLWLTENNVAVMSLQIGDAWAGGVLGYRASCDPITFVRVDPVPGTTYHYELEAEDNATAMAFGANYVIPPAIPAGDGRHDATLMVELVKQGW